MTTRKYGNPPFNVAVLHGGPGAPGYMAPVARELAKFAGVIEPLQSAESAHGQVIELKRQLAEFGHPPVTLVGSSWGAILALLLAAHDASGVRKLILVGSGVFDSANSAKITPRRVERMDEKARARHAAIESELERAPAAARPALMKEKVALFEASDFYDPLTADIEALDFQYEINVRVWSDFVAIRDEGDALRNEFAKIRIPVVVIHGDFDPHPIEAIRPFLESCLNDVTFHILAECGHYPWLERRARQAFFDLLRQETVAPVYK